MNEPVATAPVVPTRKRNRIGIAALVIVLVVIALPILTFIVFVIAALVSGAQGDDVGYAILGGWFVSAAGVAIVAPLAIVALILGIVAVARPGGYRKAQGVVAIVLAAAPSLAVFGLPAAIDSLF
jgi:hypothetical protein